MEGRRDVIASYLLALRRVPISYRREALSVKSSVWGEGWDGMKTKVGERITGVGGREVEGVKGCWRVRVGGEVL